MKTPSLCRIRPTIALGLAALTLCNTAHARRTTETDPAPEVVTSPSAPTPSVPSRMFNLESATIQDIQAAMNNGSLTSVELVSLYLRRIQAYNLASPIAPSQPLNAILFVSDDLLEDAAEADRLRKEGTVLGPLHGIPFLVKGSFPIIGMPLSGGTTGWQNFIVQHDAWTVAKMRAAGGIVMGHANMDTWAASASTSTSQIRGTVRSSYLAGAAPGGSSGGSGVASGAYLTHFAFGGETGGSIRHPSDRNGLVGYCVSGGSISVNGIIPLAPDRDVIGPMTRYAVDNAVVRDVVGAIDPDDLWNPVLPQLTTKRPVPESGFVTAVEGATLQGKKIGIIGTYVGMTHPNASETGATTETVGVQTTTAGTTALVQKAKLDMEAAGATVEYVFLPKEVSTTYPLPSGSPRLLLDRTGTNYESNVSYVHRSVIELAYDHLQPELSYHDRAVQVLARATQVNSYISSSRRNFFYTLSGGVYTPGTAIGFNTASGTEHFTARAMHHAALESWMDAQGLDAICWPTFANKTRTGGSTLGRDLANIMNLPSVTVPMGRLNQPAASGNPAGDEPLTMNISGRYFDDQKVLAVAYAYEQATKHRFAPPLAPAISGESFDANRQLRKAPSADVSAPVVTLTPTATRGPNGSISFSGTVADAGGVDRLEVSVAGSLIPASVNGSDWTAVLPSGSAANAFIYNTTSVPTVVLAVDSAGNASSVSTSVVLPSVVP